MNGGKKRTREEVIREINGVRDLFANGKITPVTHDYLLTRALDEMRANGWKFEEGE